MKNIDIYHEPVLLLVLETFFKGIIMNNPLASKFHFKETPFKQLMDKRINDILLVCSKYDKFMLDEDGRLMNSCSRNMYP